MRGDTGGHHISRGYFSARPAALPVPYAKVQRIELRDSANGKQMTKITSTAPGQQNKTTKHSSYSVFQETIAEKKTVYCYWKKKINPISSTAHSRLSGLISRIIENARQKLRPLLHET
jgi:hypothetical protein